MREKHKQAAEKLFRQEDAKPALHEHRLEVEARREKTRRLRELRLQQEAKDQDATQK